MRQENAGALERAHQHEEKIAEFAASSAHTCTCEGKVFGDFAVPPPPDLSLSRGRNSAFSRRFLEEEKSDLLFFEARVGPGI